MRQFSVRQLCFFISAGMMGSMILITGICYLVTGETAVLGCGVLLTAVGIIGISILTAMFGKRLLDFTSALCSVLDDMINSRDVQIIEYDKETLFDKIGHRLTRLYGIMQENRSKVEDERQELQTLISDISHQVKTPVANLKMMTDTLLTKQVAERERQEFLYGIRGQAEKLDFLMQGLVKTSRLETGIISLEKKMGSLYDTLAQALCGILFEAEKKNMEVTVRCPEDLQLPHDSRWTGEAFFNLLDNAVKYSPCNSTIRVWAEQWEMYVKVTIEDSGKGIPESRHASVFQRFYREEEVHNEPGVGIGLYLSREIISRQGGYIKLVSEAGKGASFSVFLPCR